MEWEESNTVEQVELNLTPSLLVVWPWASHLSSQSSGVLMGQMEMRISTSPRPYRSPLTESLPLLFLPYIPWVFLGWRAPHQPDQDTDNCCSIPLLGIHGRDFSHPSLFPTNMDPVPPSWMLPKTLGLLKLDCNSLCKSGSVAVDSFIFKGMLS